MDQEIELCLALPAELNSAFIRKLPKLLPAAGKPEQQDLLSIYYDTPNMDLQRRDMGLRLRQKGNQWIQTVKYGQSAGAGLNARAEFEHITHGPALELANIADLDARNFLCDDKIATRLQPAFTTRVQRTLWEIEDKQGNIVEVCLDVGHVSCDDRSAVVNEVEVELKQGKLEAMFAVALTLAKTFPLLPQPRSKAERGARLFTQTPIKPEGAKLPELTPDMSPIEARRLIKMECLRHLQANLPWVGQGDDMEFIHQARVAIRRMRSANKAFAALPDDATWNRLENGLQALAQMLGDVRDRDVLVHETLARIEPAFEGKIPLHVVQQALLQQREELIQKVRTAMHSPRIGTLLLHLLAWLHVDHPEDSAADGVALKDFAHAALDKRLASVEKFAKRWEKLDEPERHTLRKHVKKLRYSAEFFSSLYPQARVKKFLGSYRDVQEALGLMNDAVVSRELLQQLAVQQPAVAFAAGAAAGWEEHIGYLAVEEIMPALQEMRSAKPYW